jgi:carbon monoxide dehydrogenase subunit G
VTASFTAVVRVAAAPEVVWARLTDWPSHARWFPSTTIDVLAPNGLGGEFVARTGAGALRFPDRMRVVEWTPPRGGRAGRCTLVKLGRLLRGTAWLDVRPERGGSRVLWSERLLLPPPLGAPSRALFARALHRMASELEAELASEPDSAR